MFIKLGHRKAEMEPEKNTHTHTHTHTHTVDERESKKEGGAFRKSAAKCRPLLNQVFADGYRRPFHSVEA